jgi:hypothetical protein
MWLKEWDLRSWRVVIPSKTCVYAVTPAAKLSISDYVSKLTIYGDALSTPRLNDPGKIIATDTFKRAFPTIGMD